MNKTHIAIALTALTTSLLFGCAADDATTEAPPGGSEANATSGGGGTSGGANGGASSSGNPAANPASPDQQPPKPSEQPAAPVAGGCKEAFPAALPQVTSEFRVSAPPTPTGGDEKGTWHFTKVTAFLTTTGGALVDEESSKAEGFGFAKFDGTHFQVASDITQTVSTKFAGKVVQATLAKIAGKYTRGQAGHITFEPECQEIEPASSQTEPTDTSFSRVSETEALIHQTVETQIGKVTIVTTMKKAN